MKVKYWLSSASSYPSSYSSSAYLDSLVFGGNLSIPCLTLTRYDARYARSSRVEMNYSQCFQAAVRALIIMGFIFLRSLAYSSIIFSYENCFISYTERLYYFMYYYLASSTKNGLIFEGRSSRSGFQFFSFFIFFSSLRTLSYSSRTVENLLKFLSSSSAGSKRKLFTFFNSS